MHTKNKFFLNKQEFEYRTRAALVWLKKSFTVNKGNGSSAYYTQLWKPFGWTLAYPETTGYIIETLLDYDQLYPEMRLKEYALQAADWICGLQLNGGAFPGGLVNSKVPSVFNTGQMIIGLICAYELTGNTKYYQAFKQAVYWLINNLEKDGSWTVGAYIKNYVPSYYTRVVWSVLWANKHIGDPNIQNKMKLALDFYRKRETEKRTVSDLSFRKGQKAFTHTIAYTIRGFYESSLCINDSEINSFAISLAHKLLSLREIKGKLAGWYDEEWKGDYWFTCLTGNCQIAIIFCRIYEQIGDVRYLNVALKIFDDILPYQKLKGGINKKGALAGSAPFFGRYIAFRYPNWATKFFLDAYRLLYIHVNQLEEKV